MLQEFGQGDPELIFALVAPVGTPTDVAMQALEAALSGYGYDFDTIKLSGLLADLALTDDRPLPTTPEDARIVALMDAGDALCADRKDPAAVIKEGVAELRRLRREDVGPGRPDDESTRENEARLRQAYLFDSLKRPAEISQLREIYGDHLIVLSLGAKDETRRQLLHTRLRPTKDDVPLSLEKRIEDLIERDLREDAVTGRGVDSRQFAQNIQRAFPMGDVFIEVEDDPSAQIQRLIDLVFGHPEYREPTDDEFAMHLAHTSRTRSPELGLRVGAAIADQDGSVLAVGSNRHPTSKGTPDYDSSGYDIQDLLRDLLVRLGKESFSSAFWDGLTRAPGSFVTDLLAGSLADAKVKDLTEFQPTVHAEMNALLDALRRGVTIEDATIFVTAFPCHNCAKHLAAMGLKVRYIEPYPKSRAETMFPDHVRSDYEPFIGIAPVRYQAIFEVSGDRKGSDGTRNRWTHDEKFAARPQVDKHLDQHGIAEREATATTVENPSSSVGESTPETFDNG